MKKVSKLRVNDCRILAQNLIDKRFLGRTAVSVNVCRKGTEIAALA